MKTRLAAVLLPAACLTVACNNKPINREANRTIGQVPVDPKLAPPPVPDNDRYVSTDTLARPQNPGPVVIKHVLLSWKELASEYRGQQDERGAKRTRKEAGELARKLAARLRSGGNIDEIIKEFSEDRGGNQDGYEIRGDREFVPGFKDMALRMEPSEVAIGKTQFGYHVMYRVPPPPPDPLESSEVLARQAIPLDETAWIKHVLIGWRDIKLPGHRTLSQASQARSKEQADTQVKALLARLRAGEPIEPMMNELSDDMGSSKDGKAYEVKADAGMVEPFKNLARRLQIGEAGLVKTVFGWHVMLRVPPPPPDPAESADILARTEVVESASVKHILLSWKDLGASYGGQQDPRGAARERADADKLVETLVARLKKGEAIEPLMKEFSEDPGSAASGQGYPVTPGAGLVEPFKKLSLRLKKGEVGVVLTQFGLHIIQRTE